MRHYDLVVVGAGITGCVTARRMADAGCSVLVIEQREHIGGNCYDMPDEHGIVIHPYGPHIFHTSKPHVAEYLSRFTGWRNYTHKVLGIIEGLECPLPFNLTSLQHCFSSTDAIRYEQALLKGFGLNAQVSILELQRAEDPCLVELANFIYEKVFLGYTVKQWGLIPGALPDSVTARVPVRVSHDDRYFTDSFQAMPDKGYARMFESMLDAPGIELSLGTSFQELASDFSWKHCVYTGPIDAFFEYSLGALGYRSLEFKFEHLEQDRYQNAAVVNYPDPTVPYTRISEFKFLSGQDTLKESAGTTICREYPQPCRSGHDIPYYPIPTVENFTVYAAYQDLTAREAPSVTFAGRLGEFRYYNMDDAVDAALRLTERLLCSG